MNKKDPVYFAIALTLKKYSDTDRISGLNRISIRRARYAIGVCHRFKKATITGIIRRLTEERLIELNRAAGMITIIDNKVSHTIFPKVSQEANL